MPHCDCNKFIEIFQQFRHRLYTNLPNRRDTLMDLLDALSSNQTARSPVELSLNPLFRRNYSALYKAVEHFNFNPDGASGLGEDTGSPEVLEQLTKQQSLQQVIAEIIPTPKQRLFYLLGLDVTPIPRPYAQTLEERTFIYQPNPIKGNKPINIGHPYSILSVLPERTDGQAAPWCIPLSAQRVLPTQKGTEVGSAQLENALSRDFSRIIAQIGTPAVSPKPRGYSPGRNKGYSLPPRPKQKVIKKSQKQRKNWLSSA